MNKTKSKSPYYDIGRILDCNCDYNLIFGERGNGKTYAALAYALRNYVERGEQLAYVRRWREDLRGKRAETLFANHTANGFIQTITDGKYNEVFYLGGKWFLSNYDAEKGKRYPDVTPFAYAFCLSEQEHEKSSSYPHITSVVFDEFITRRYYLPDEFMLFMNLLSTIIRQRENVKIFMLGNTINKYCPYFGEFGLKNIAVQEQGTIDVYQFGERGARVAVEYCDNVQSEKPSNKYFCFDNQNLQMITGGKWEVSIYPHLPTKYKPKDVIFVFYIIYGDTILQGNVIDTGADSFVYIHPKTTAIKDDSDTLIYSLVSTGKPNYKRRLLSTATPLEARISKYFATDKVFYQSNEVGEIVRNYVERSLRSNIQGS